MKQVIKMYLHSTKENNLELAHRNELEFASQAAETEFMYALYEVELDVEVDLDNGKETILAVNGIPLGYPSAE